MGGNTELFNLINILTFVIIVLTAVVPFVLAMIKRKKTFYIASITGGAVAIVFLIVHIFFYMSGGTNNAYYAAIIFFIVLPNIVIFIIALIKKNRLMVVSFVLSIFMISYALVNFGVPIIYTLAESLDKETIYNVDVSNNDSYGLDYLYYPERHQCTKTVLNEYTEYLDDNTTKQHKTVRYDYGICEYSLTYTTTTINATINNVEVTDIIRNEITEFNKMSYQGGYIFDLVNYGEEGITINKGIFQDLSIHYLSLDSSFTITNDNPFNNCVIEVLVVKEKEIIPEKMSFPTSYLYTLFKTNAISYIVPLTHFYINNSEAELLQRNKVQNIDAEIILDVNKSYKYFVADFIVTYQFIFNSNKECDYNEVHTKHFYDQVFVDMMNNINLGTADGQPLQEYLGHFPFVFILKINDGTYGEKSHIYDAYSFTELITAFDGLRWKLDKSVVTNWFYKNDYYTKMTGIPINSSRFVDGTSYSFLLRTEYDKYYHYLNRYINLRNGIEYVYELNCFKSNNKWFSNVEGFHIIRQDTTLKIYLPDIIIDGEEVTMNYYSTGEHTIFSFLNIDELHFYVEGSYSNNKVVTHSSV